jgi:hypothetical protein
MPENQNTAAASARNNAAQNLPSQAPKVHFTDPITKDQVTTDNRRDAFDALRQEVDRDEAFGNGQDLTPAPTSARRGPPGGRE